MTAAVLRARTPGGLASEGGVPLAPKGAWRRASAGRGGILVSRPAIIGIAAGNTEIA